VTAFIVPKRLTLQLCCWLVLLLAVVRSLAAKPTQPNIILIMADDLGYGSLGCYGNTVVRTPHIDQLAKSGIRFTDFHSNGPLCSPTRAALLTGRYQQRCQWVADEELSPVFQQQRRENPIQRWAWGISTKELTIAELLKQHGYHTGIIGKWHLGYDVKFHPLNFGFAEFRGFMGGNVDYHTHIASHGLKELDWWHNREIKNEIGYTTDLLTSYATDFIAKHKERPFFLYLSHAAVHVPLQGRDPTAKKSATATYQEMLSCLDESVGKVLDELRKQQLEKQTLVIFCSDNGGVPVAGINVNGKLSGKKGTLAEGGLRVPMIASWPSVIPAGTTNDETIMSMDILPTCAGLAAAKLPASHEWDGCNITTSLQGKSSLPDRVLHWSSGEAWAIRRSKWKLIGRGANASALYDLKHDLAETTNLIKNETKLVDELLALHRQWSAKVGSR
jgi:arylsulfatase A